MTLKFEFTSLTSTTYFRKYLLYIVSATLCWILWMLVLQNNPKLQLNKNLPSSQTSSFSPSKNATGYDLQLDNFNICTKGPQIVDRDFMLAELATFIKVYEHRPQVYEHQRSENLWGTLFSHQFALWVTARRLKPLHIIESGVQKGGGTWILRQAAPDAQLILLDPNDAELAYKDTHSSTIYFKAHDFLDFRQIDWKALNVTTDQTLVFFDDHQSALRRTKEAYGRGFRYIMFDDNYSPKKYDNLSLKIMCGIKLGIYEAKDLQYKDNFGKERRLFKPGDFKMMDFLFDAVVKSYMEFPIPWSGDDIHNNTLVKNNNQDGLYTMNHPNQFFEHPQRGFNNICLLELDTNNQEKLL